MRIILMILGLLLIILQLEVWRQHIRVGELQTRLSEQRAANQDLAERNAALAAEVDDLRSGYDAVEERARAELGLIREGEEFYLVVEPEDLDPGDARALEEFEARRAASGAETPAADDDSADASSPSRGDDSRGDG